MKAKEPLVAHSLAILLLVLWLGFFIHRDPRFAGSLMGGIFAVSGSIFLLVPLFYSLIKRIKWLKERVIPHISFGKLLTIHIYSGFIGALLVLLHTGHKFNGIVATSLTAFLLIVVFSGYLGRYLFSMFAKDLGEKKKTLSELHAAFDARGQSFLNAPPEERSLLPVFSGFFSRLLSPFLLRRAVAAPAVQRTEEALALAESISDVELAIKTHERFKSLFTRWLKIHIILSAAFYLFLLLHMAAELYYGLRWFE